jgi:acyl-CoA synthetase (AMP-forming)/AMP-acid ligase II
MGAIAVSPEQEGASGSRSDGLLQPLPQVKVTVDGNNGPILCRHNAGFESYMDAQGRAVFLPDAADGWYKTMDLGIAADDGCFYVAGRMDNCINRSGFLISLDGIASSLEEILPEINQAVVLGVDGEHTDSLLLAVCESSGTAPPDTNAIRKLCREKMNKYTVPDRFHFVGSLPRLPNGKPDRASLIKLYNHQ